MTETIQFHTATGGPAAGVLAVPSTPGKHPGVVVIQEWWGVNAHIRSLLERLAEAGFVALAPDLYHGFTTKNADEASKHMAALDWGKALDEIGGAKAALAAHPACNGKVGVTGFCMGGALTYASACTVPGLGAAASFYGMPDPSKFDWSKVTAPIQAHVADRDQWVTPANAKALQKTLTGLGKRVDLHVYAADHAFVNDTRPEVYNPTAAKEAWDRMVGFMHANLD